MNPKNIKTILILVILAVVILAGCASNGDADQEKEPVLGMANPASVYCQGLDFMEETRENELGQYGVCLFDDGSECDTWDFLAGLCGQEHSYCVQQGYELRSDAQSKIGTCVFGDGSTCDEFSYFKGDCKPGDNMP